MNKQEAIEELKKYKGGFGEAAAVRFDRIVSVISQIDQPQKVVVPKCIADKIEYCKTAEGYGLFHAMDYCYQYKDSADWLECNQETFACAWLFGYEIEQEKLYTVEIPDPNRPDIATFLYKENGKVFIGTDIFLDEVPNYKWKNEPENQLTESEIKEDFEWAWQFREEVD
ncbi:TPA: DUF1642 domain-containing protein [Streptococcus suis]|nr:DUF1642 domain-containing protein [Streptococcus suis]